MVYLWGRSANNKETLKIRQAGYFFKLKELVADKKLKKQGTNINKAYAFLAFKEGSVGMDG